MATIKPSAQFDRSEMSTDQLGKILKPDVRTVTFNKNNNKEGLYLYLLPAYKVDSQGRGVWYNVINVRDNFGDRMKDRYVVWDRENDPIAYFEAQIKQLFPDQALVTKKMVNNREQKAYPLYGRITKRVLYNVAIKKDMAAGAHVLELPQANGASLIDMWQRSADANGDPRPLLSDPDRCVPVFFKLDNGSGESPWKIIPSAESAAKLPATLTDSDNLYDLDNVFYKRTADDLIEKLRGMYHPDIFKKCMAGYSGMSETATITKPEIKTEAVPGPRITAEAERAPCVEHLADITVPKATIAGASAVPKEVTDADEARRIMRGMKV